MASFYVNLIPILMLSTAWGAQNFVPVSVCPRDENSWNTESKRKNCQGDTPDYLCAAIENQVGKFGEICTKSGLTPAKKCAVLNEQTYNLDSVDCKADKGCPEKPYIPIILWQYQICYQDFYGTTTSSAPSTNPIITTEAASSRNDTVWDGSNGGGAGAGAGVAAAVIILIIVVVGILVFIIYKRDMFGFKTKMQPHFSDLRMHFQCDQTENDQISAAENGESPSQTTEPLLPKGPESKDIGANADPESKDIVATTEPVYAKPEKAKTRKGKDDELDKEVKIQKLEELLKYLVHILKQELDVNDLKEKVVLHSKSMKEHFTELLIQDLQNLKEVNDYSRLDMSLVFALLRNFCDGIKPPRRGWDYEPPDDETHVGADIERIRSMWNKHCDNDFQFKHLDQVYNRMKEKYGTIAVLGDDGNREPPHKGEQNADGNREPPHKGEKNAKESTLMIKVQSIKLNPDCLVEKGNVITENITSALKILQSSNVVILKGAIGCGKTHALMSIENHYKGTKWETKWVEFQNIKGEISKDKPTILLCDNLFGRFGSCVFSQDAVNETEKVLKDIEDSKSETKIVIGIHTHVYDEIKKSLKLNFLHQRTITVEMDNLSNAETLLIFKEQLKKGHCKKDANCWFKSVGFQSVLDKLSKNQGHIGGPFLSLMYCNCHEFFSDAAFSVNPVRSVMQHIERVSHDSPSVYDCLVYLMCVQQHSIKAEPKKWAGLISINITKHSLMDLAQTSGLIKVENEIATPAHELLTIVLFKSAAQKREIVFPVLQVCERDIFLQLLRPTESTHSDLNFECIFDSSQHSRDIGKMCTYVLANMYKKQEINHPLMKVDLVKEKYLRYLSHKPKDLTIIDKDHFEK